MRPALAVFLAAVPLMLVGGFQAAYALDNANAASIEQAPVLREIEPFKAAIIVRSPYDRAVRVKQVDATCSCAQLEMRERFLLPHATALLDILVKNENRSGPQDIHVSVYLSDPELEPIEVDALWTVRACIQVDAIAPGADPKPRPADRAWQDIYRFVVEERPDEPQRLRKRIRLSCPPEEQPPGGLQVLGVDCDSKLWSFTVIPQPEKEGGSVLILAKAKEGLDPMPLGEFHEQALVRTNHPDKPTVVLRFDSLITMDPGARLADPLIPPGP